MCNKCVLVTGFLSCAYAGILQYKLQTTTEKEDPTVVRGLRMTVISVIAGMTGVAIGTQLPEKAVDILVLTLAAGSLVELTHM